MTRRHIIKGSSAQLPFVALNEHLCMQVASRAMPTVKTELSDDGQALVVHRFDVDAHGQPHWGMEDFCSLRGLRPAAKYDTTWERIAKAVHDHVPGHERLHTDRQLATILLLTYALRNADCHAKNIALLYTGRADVHLSPAYDMLTTSVYAGFQHNLPGIKFMGKKSWAPDKNLQKSIATTFGIQPKEQQHMMQAISDAMADVGPLVRQAMAQHPGFDAIGKRMLMAWAEGVQGLRGSARPRDGATGRRVRPLNAFRRHRNKRSILPKRGLLPCWASADWLTHQRISTDLLSPSTLRRCSKTVPTSFMCSHYQLLKDRELYLLHFGCPPPAHPYVHDLWPGSTGVLLRRPREADSGDEAVPARESLVGRFGLLPHWAKDEKFARHTYNARSETVHEKPSFRDAWKHAQHCIIPADAIFEPDWRSGKAVATRIARTDGAPMGIAGLWSSWRSPAGEQVHSYTMLTINADAHALMRNFHRPGDEKRMVVILAEGSYDDWLHASAEQARAFLQPYPADRLTAGMAAD